MAKFKLRINPKAAASVTQQVADQIRGALESGAFEPGELLPSEMAIAAQLGMSRGVGKKAYGKLAGLGLFTSGPRGRVAAGPRGGKAAAGQGAGAGRGGAAGPGKAAGEAAKKAAKKAARKSGR
jgi:DNA-binding transcriptional MocR family regulator